MANNYLDPARSIIAKFGGVENVAKITERHPSNVYRWMYPRENGGTGGRIPQLEAEKLLKNAREQNISVTADHFFAGVGA